MLKKYKKSHLIINIILGLLLVFFLLNIFVLKKTSYEILTLSILIPTSLIILIFGYEWKSRRFKYELIFYIFAYCTVFLLITYTVGISIGFSKNIYKLNFSNLIHNIIPYAILIVVTEVLRYEITRKGDGSLLSHILVTIVLILVDASIFLNLYDLRTGDGQIKYICAILMPSFFKNVALIYFTKNGGIYPSLLYRLIMDLKLVIAPIFPNFGLYYDCIINTVFPLLIVFITYMIVKNSKAPEESPVNIRKTKKLRYLIYFIVLALLLSINLLVGCTLKYCMIAIGSGSMTPTINKGDAVIYEKYESKNPPKVGQILVFKKDNKTIVHRIIEVVEVNNERIYYTKGDNNESPDGYPIESSQILGTVKSKIRYIGIPSVALSEMIK